MVDNNHLFSMRNKFKQYIYIGQITHKKNYLIDVSENNQ